MSNIEQRSIPSIIRDTHSHNFCFSTIGVSLGYLESLTANIARNVRYKLFLTDTDRTTFLTIFIPKNQLNSKQPLTRLTIINFPSNQLRKKILLSHYVMSYTHTHNIEKSHQTFHTTKQESCTHATIPMLSNHFFKGNTRLFPKVSIHTSSSIICEPTRVVVSSELYFFLIA